MPNMRFEENSEMPIAIDSLEYGCLFCTVGAEDRIAQELMLTSPEIKTIVTKKENTQASKLNATRGGRHSFPKLYLLYGPSRILDSRCL